MTEQELTAVSLFAGVGGFDIAFERNGVKVAAAVEIDDAARGVLAHRFPTTTLFTDVCEVTGDDLRAAGFVPERGILVGGFPCQDLSVAGKRAGLAGRRSGLFWEICRLLDETKPRWFILENVPGLLSSQSGRDMGAVVAALVERGYGISWRVLDAQHFGVPQRRRRVFIVGCLGDDGQAPFEVLAIGEGRERYLEESQSKGKKPATEASAGSGSSRPVSALTANMAGAGGGVDDNTAQGGHLVVQDALAFRMRGFGDYEADETASALKARDFKDATDLVVSDSEAVVLQDREGKPGGGKGPLLSVESSFSLRTSNFQTLFPPALAFYSTGGSRGLNEQTEVSPPLKVGSGLDIASPPAVTYVKAGRARSADDAETWREDVVSPTLNVFDNGGDTRATVLPIQSSVVRRLTPTECERLQGFPDGWTAERFDFKKQQVITQPDSARYKQMGNAVAVPVVSWIISRIVAWEAGEL